MADADHVESSLDLLERARAGDAEAIDRFCRRFRPILRRWAAGRLPQWARDFIDSDDLVQDTLLRTVHKLESFELRHDGALHAYLRQALQNRIRDEIRRKQRAPERGSLDSETPDAAPSPLEETVGLENLERYEAALARLDDEDRELIILRVEMGLSYPELAAAVCKPTANAARMSVMRAVVRLGHELNRDG
jgi:RNA polymerase sigma-70 factor (ECF subfamily)